MMAVSRRIRLQFRIRPTLSQFSRFAFGNRLCSIFAARTVQYLYQM